MRNIAVNDVDDLPRRVLALGSDYPANTQLARHSHRRAQFLYAMNGMMKVARPIFRAIQEVFHGSAWAMPAAANEARATGGVIEEITAK